MAAALAASRMPKPATTDARLMPRIVRRRAEAARGSSWSDAPVTPAKRSEEHTSELQSLMRISYAVFCLKKKKKHNKKHNLVKQECEPNNTRYYDDDKKR